MEGSCQANKKPCDDRPLTTNLEFLKSYTHRYSAPPDDYDDSQAGGGRTYFLRPLPFRNGYTGSPPGPLPLPGIYARRRREHVLPLYPDFHVPRMNYTQTDSVSSTDEASQVTSETSKTSSVSSGSPGALVKDDDIFSESDSDSASDSASNSDSASDDSDAYKTAAADDEAAAEAPHVPWSHMAMTPRSPARFLAIEYVSKYALLDDLPVRDEAGKLLFIDADAARRAADERWEQRQAAIMASRGRMLSNIIITSVVLLWFVFLKWLGRFSV